MPHDGGLSRAGGTRTGAGTAPKSAQSNAQVEAEEKHHKQASQDLETEHQKLEKRAAKLAARKDTNTRNYRRTVSRLNRDRAGHAGRPEEFIKDNRAKTTFGAELYVDQGDPAVNDKMMFCAKMARQCSKHPSWTLWDCSTNEWADWSEPHRTEWNTDGLLPPVIDYSTMPQVVMDTIRSILDAGLDLEVAVEMSANVTCKWNQAPEKEIHFVPGGGIRGKAVLASGRTFISGCRY